MQLQTDGSQMADGSLIAIYRYKMFNKYHNSPHKDGIKWTNCKPTDTKENVRRGSWDNRNQSIKHMYICQRRLISV